MSYDPKIQINAQYLKDLSYENPKILEVLTKPLEKAPGVGVEVQIDAKQVGEANFEVTLITRVDTRADEKTEPLSILEVSYAGIFTLPELPEEEKKEAILVACPTMLFPFVRALVASVTKESGLMPITLTPVDFMALYEQKKDDIKEKKGTGK